MVIFTELIQCVVIRNGILYGDEADEDDDICVLYYDGVMKTFAVDDSTSKSKWKMELIRLGASDLRYSIIRGCYRKLTTGLQC